MKLSLYIETSVIGACLDNGDAFRRDVTIRWWEHELSEYRLYSSLLVQRELERIGEPHRQRPQAGETQNVQHRRRFLFAHNSHARVPRPHPLSTSFRQPSFSPINEFSDIPRTRNSKLRTLNSRVLSTSTLGQGSY